MQCVCAEDAPPAAVPSNTELLRAWLADNATSAHPLPVCQDCSFPYQARDEHWLFRDRCNCCGLDHIEALVRAYVNAQSKKARKKALKAIKRLAK